MKKIIYLFSAIALLLSLSLQAEEPICCCEVSRPHHISFGPEFFWMHINEKVDWLHIKGTPFFGGGQLRYEYLKGNSVYCGLDLRAAYTSSHFKISYKDSHEKVEFNFNNELLFINMEGRLGYTFAPKNLLFTPVLGVGLYNLTIVKNFHPFKDSADYALIGARLMYNWSDLFNTGLNLKIFRTFYAEHFLNGHEEWWGGEVGVPLLWNVDCNHRFNIQLEPYFEKLNFSRAENIYGFKALVEYRF